MPGADHTPVHAWNGAWVSLHHQGCVMRLTDTCRWQDKECASPNDGRGGFTNRAGKEACKWSDGGWNMARRSAHAAPRASLRMRRGLRSCPPQRVVGSPAMVTCPDSRVMRSCVAHESTPPSVLYIPYICLCFHVFPGLISGTHIQNSGCTSRISRRVPPGFPSRDELLGVPRLSSCALARWNHRIHRTTMTDAKDAFAPEAAPTRPRTWRRFKWLSRMSVR